MIINHILRWESDEAIDQPEKELILAGNHWREIKQIILSDFRFRQETDDVKVILILPPLYFDSVNRGQGRNPDIMILIFYHIQDHTGKSFFFPQRVTPAIVSQNIQTVLGSEPKCSFMIFQDLIVFNTAPVKNRIRLPVLLRNPYIILRRIVYVQSVITPDHQFWLLIYRQRIHYFIPLQFRKPLGQQTDFTCFGIELTDSAISVDADPQTSRRVFYNSPYITEIQLILIIGIRISVCPYLATFNAVQAIVIGTYPNSFLTVFIKYTAILLIEFFIKHIHVVWFRVITIKPLCSPHQNISFGRFKHTTDFFSIPCSPKQILIAQRQFVHAGMIIADSLIEQSYPYSVILLVTINTMNAIADRFAGQQRNINDTVHREVVHINHIKSILNRSNPGISSFVHIHRRKPWIMSQLNIRYLIPFLVKDIIVAYSTIPHYPEVSIIQYLHYHPIIRFELSFQKVNLFDKAFLLMIIATHHSLLMNHPTKLAMALHSQ